MCRWCTPCAKCKCATHECRVTTVPFCSQGPAAHTGARWCTPCATAQVQMYKCWSVREDSGTLQSDDGGDRGVVGQNGEGVDSKRSLSYCDGWHRPYFSGRIGLLSCTLASNFGGSPGSATGLMVESSVTFRCPSILPALLRERVEFQS